MVDPEAETNSNLSLQDAASLLMETTPAEDTSSELEAPPEEIITDQDQVMPSNEATDESEEFDS